MKNAVARLCAWVCIALCICPALAHAQVLELYAGGERFVDIPGDTIGLQPGGVLAAPDGYVYVNDINGKLMRLNVSTGLVTALPAIPGGLNHNLGYSYGLALDGSGIPHVYSSGGLHRIEADGTLTRVGDISFAGPLALAPDGTVYVVPGDHRVYAQQPSSEYFVVAGGEEAGFAGDGGPASAALLNNPTGIAVAVDGDVFIADKSNHRIRRISATDGVITTFAGTGSGIYVTDGLHFSQASIPSPDSLAFDNHGNLFVSIYNGILRIDAVSGIVTRVGGGGNGPEGGPAIGAAMRPRFLSVDPLGNIFFSDWGTNYQKVRKIDASTGIVSLAIGFDSTGFCGENVPARMACLYQPYALDIDAAGDLLIGDIASQRIRKVTAGAGIISTWKMQQSALGIEHDAAGNTFVATYDGYAVHRHDAVTGAKTVVAGGRGYGSGGDGGPATSAFLAAPNDVAIDADGNLYISDSGNNRIRKVTAATGIISTYATGFSSPGTLEFDPAGNLIVSDRSNCRLRKIDATTGAITTIVGTGVCDGRPPEGGLLATATKIGSNPSFAIDRNGNIFLGWSTPHIFRVDAATGILTRVPAPADGLATPEGLRIRRAAKMEFDAAGRLYVSQDIYPHNYIFRVTGVVDSTPPEIVANVNGAAGPGGWYRSDVEINWSVSDAESAVNSTSGCEAASVTEDTDGVTFTCAATSDGGTSTRSVTIRRDTVAPTLEFGDASPAADPSGYHSSDVSFAFTVADALSGVYSTSTGNPVVVTGEGRDLTAQIVVTDLAGNTATFTTPRVSIERSPPVITSRLLGTTFFDDWYVTNVQVSFSVTDPQSPVSSQEGCGPTTVTEDTAGVTFTCTATSSGGTASASVTVKRDSTPPTVTLGTPSPAPGPNGWYTGPVSIPWTVSDELSGFAFADQPNPIVISEEGVGLTRKLSVRDAARVWQVVDTPPINIDFSPPTVQPQVTGTLGNDGWYTSDVQVSWAIGEAPQNILSSDGCGNSSVTEDTAGITFTCTVVSGGGIASNSVTLKRDATPPALTFGTPSPTPNANGWNKTNVSIAFTRSDAMSGLASTSTTSPLVLSTEGEGVTRDVVVTDNAGNTATYTSVPRNIDKTAPEAEMNTPADFATYGFYQDVVADFWCNDIAILSCTAPVANGALVNTRTAGARTFRVTAINAAGLTTNHTHSFTVESSFNFGGFQAPLQTPPTLNLVSRGALVPIRWQLPDGRGGFVTNPASFASATVGSLSCGSAASVPLEDTAVGPAGIGFDAATNSFVYNWQTSASWTGCRRLTIKLKDNSTRELRFRFQ